jgi:ABC-type multidrug transport system ATPase subunit
MIVTRALGLRIGGRTILEGIDLRVREGESVALVGPNGSGKTSVLRALLGLVPFTGQVSIAGHDLHKQPLLARAATGYIPQRPAFGGASVREVLSFSARLRRIPSERIDRVLASVGLSEHHLRPAKTLSGGMQQRLSLALALLTEAPVMLLDEPTASLDREGQATFLEIVLRLRQEGRTLLLALHRSEEIARLVDRVVELEHGRIVEAPAEVLPLVSIGGRR